jgi:hypothetical protein
MLTSISDSASILSKMTWKCVTRLPSKVTLTATKYAPRSGLGLCGRKLRMFFLTRVIAYMAIDENVHYDDDGDVVNLPLHRSTDMYGNSRWWLQGLSVSSIPPSTTLPLTINPSSQLQSISHSIPPRSTLPPPSIAKLILSSRTSVTTATFLPTTRNSMVQTSERSDALDTSTKRTALLLSLRPIPRPATTIRQSCR